jgi:hypothetical protein
MNLFIFKNQSIKLEIMIVNTIIFFKINLLKLTNSKYHKN